MATATETQTEQQAQAMQEAWAAYSTPGDMHKMLADESGAWDVSITFWQQAGAEPQTDQPLPK